MGMVWLGSDARDSTAKLFNQFRHSDCTGEQSSRRHSSRICHAEDYPADEMKHGPNALIDEAFTDREYIVETGPDSYRFRRTVEKGTKPTV